jgi:hypothetical protein
MEHEGVVESLHSLPPEVFSLIARYLSAEDKRNARLTSKAARALIDLVWQPLKGVLLFLRTGTIYLECNHHGGSLCITQDQLVPGVCMSAALFG